MTLDEIVSRLPPAHRAREELTVLRGRVETLETVDGAARNYLHWYDNPAPDPNDADDEAGEPLRQVLRTAMDPRTLADFESEDFLDPIEPTVPMCLSRIRQLEGALAGANVILAEKDAEIASLRAQLAARS
jgi:hypothetical protein